MNKQHHIFHKDLDNQFFLIYCNIINECLELKELREKLNEFNNLDKMIEKLNASKKN